MPEQERRDLGDSCAVSSPSHTPKNNEKTNSKPNPGATTKSSSSHSDDSDDPLVRFAAPNPRTFKTKHTAMPGRPEC